MRYFFRILFVPYQRFKMVHRNIIFYVVALFWTILALCICQFRIYFMDDALTEIYEKKYQGVSGIFHFFPGKFEIFLVSLFLVPIWIIHFLFGGNLNDFCETQSLDEQESEEFSETRLSDEENPQLSLEEHNSRQSDTRRQSGRTRTNSNLNKANLPKDILVETYDKTQQSDSFKKKIVIVRSWEQLSYAKKIYRVSILFGPLFLIFIINLAIQYTVAYMVSQTNFNLANVAGDIIAFYLYVLHFTIIVPQIFWKSNCLLEGDYLWNPGCTVVIRYHEGLDVQELNQAIQSYDLNYLRHVSDTYTSGFQTADFELRRDGTGWKRFRTGEQTADFSQGYFDDAYGHSRIEEDSRDYYDDDDETNQHRGMKSTVKYTTYEAKRSVRSMSQHVDPISEDMSVETQQTLKTISSTEKRNSKINPSRITGFSLGSGIGTDESGVNLKVKSGSGSSKGGPEIQITDLKRDEELPKENDDLNTLKSKACIILF